MPPSNKLDPGKYAFGFGCGGWIMLWFFAMGLGMSSRSVGSSLASDFWFFGLAIAVIPALGMAYFYEKAGHTDRGVKIALTYAVVTFLGFVFLLSQG